MARHAAGAVLHGQAVQVDPIKPTLKSLETKPSKVKYSYDGLLSRFAFNFNLRHHMTAACVVVAKTQASDVPPTISGSGGAG